MNDALTSPEDVKKLQNFVTLVYVLQAATFGVLVTYFIAPLVVVWLKKQVKGTWLESHLRWQMNSFWFSLVGVIGGVLAMAHPAGLIILSATSMWFVFRIGQGWTRLSRHQAMVSGTR